MNKLHKGIICIRVVLIFYTIQPNYLMKSAKPDMSCAGTEQLPSSTALNLLSHRNI